MSSMLKQAKIVVSELGKSPGEVVGVITDTGEEYILAGVTRFDLHMSKGNFTLSVETTDFHYPSKING